MPLGEKAGWEKSESLYCGVETEFYNDIPQLLSFNLSQGSFDFVVAPLMDPAYRPSSIEKDKDGSPVPPFAGSDLVLSPSQWSTHVVGKISSWIDLDSEDEILRTDSETTLKQEISWANHLSLQACVLPTPKGASFGNYARCVNQILCSLNTMQLWLRVPLLKNDEDSIDEKPENLIDSWQLWNSFRLLCEHNTQLSVALDVLSSLPSANSLGRWFGEPVRAALINTDSFLTNARGWPCLSKRHQQLIAGFFNHSVQIIISGEPVHALPKESSDLASKHIDGNRENGQIHPLKSYLDYVGYLFQRMDPLSEQERFEFGYRDFLQSPLQPLMDNLEAQTYETFEKDSMKYIQYQRAICKALVDRVPDKEAAVSTTVLMVVGAGRGPLVRASLQAAEETGRRLKVYAVEKNPNAVVTLHSLVKLEGWENIVTIISCDMRCWEAPEKADILVSELLGSFGDNELSPECLDDLSLKGTLTVLYKDKLGELMKYNLCNIGYDLVKDCFSDTCFITQLQSEMISPQLNRVLPKEFPVDPELIHFEKRRSCHPPFSPNVESSIPSDRRALHESQRFLKEALPKVDRLRFNPPPTYPHTAGISEEIAMKCGTKVEYKPGLVASRELQFSVEAWFAGEKVSVGIGRTRREAQHQAAEGSIKNLANIYMSRAKPDSGSPNGDAIGFPFPDGNDFLGSNNPFGNQAMSAVTALKELCMIEGLGVVFQAQSPSLANMHENEVHAQVEIDGQVLGNGTGLTWDEAKMQAAEKALGNLRSLLGRRSHKRQGSPRSSLQGMPSKRPKPEFPRARQRIPSTLY